jgi:hypothetical protein
MDRVRAEEDIKLIRDIMEKSARYTHFTGLSGVISGFLGLAGCWATVWIALKFSFEQQKSLFIITWVAVLVLALVQDFALAQRNAKRSGGSIWTPATYQVLKAVFPGVFVAFIISLECLREGSYAAIPCIWALGYGAALCAAGMVSTREVSTYGVIQLVTGSLGLLLLSSRPENTFYLLALSFGVYQILFGLWMARKQRS